MEPSQVIGTLRPVFSKHRFRVVPVVAVADADPTSSCRPNSGEVSAVFAAPLELFVRGSADPDRYWTADFPLAGRTFRSHFFRHLGRDQSGREREFVVWGLTAAVCIEVACAVFGQKPEFEVLPPEEECGAQPPQSRL